jgi:hypothetical protein
MQSHGLCVDVEVEVKQNSESISAEIGSGTDFYSIELDTYRRASSKADPCSQLKCPRTSRTEHLGYAASWLSETGTE